MSKQAHDYVPQKKCVSLCATNNTGIERLSQTRIFQSIYITFQHGFCKVQILYVSKDLKIRV